MGRKGGEKKCDVLLITTRDRTMQFSRNVKRRLQNSSLYCVSSQGRWTMDKQLRTKPYVRESLWRSYCKQTKPEANYSLKSLGRIGTCTFLAVLATQ